MYPYSDEPEADGLCAVVPTGTLIASVLSIWSLTAGLVVSMPNFPPPICKLLTET